MTLSLPAGACAPAPFLTCAAAADALASAPALRLLNLAREAGLLDVTATRVVAAILGAPGEVPGEYTIAAEQIATLAGCSRRTVPRVAASLEARGLLTRERGRGTKNAPNVYRLDLRALSALPVALSAPGGA